jgi:hypothetical protein
MKKRRDYAAKLVHIYPDYQGSNDRRGVPIMTNSWALADSMRHWAGNDSRWIGTYPVVVMLVGIAVASLADVISSGFGTSIEELLWRLTLIVVGFGAGVATLVWKLRSMHAAE